MSRGLSTPNIVILGCGDLAVRIEGSPPAIGHTNIQELSQTRLSPFFPVSLCGITLLVIYSLRAQHAFTVEFRNSEAIRVFDFAFSLNSVHRLDSAAMKFEDGDDGPPRFLGYFHLLHARLAPYASDQVAALGTDPLLVGWSELHILILNVVPSCKYMPVWGKTSSRKKKLKLVCRPGQGISGR
jgi:hypothetical protein